MKRVSDAHMPGLSLQGGIVDPNEGNAGPQGQFSSRFGTFLGVQNVIRLVHIIEAPIKTRRSEGEIKPFARAVNMFSTRMRVTWDALISNRAKAGLNALVEKITHQRHKTSVAKATKTLLCISNVIQACAKAH